MQSTKIDEFKNDFKIPNRLRVLYNFCLCVHKVRNFLAIFICSISNVFLKVEENACYDLQLLTMLAMNVIAKTISGSGNVCKLMLIIK